MTDRPEIVAVYFSSYHRDELYDRWYGPGWNEWKLMEQARPLFPGHEQPKLCTWNEWTEGCYLLPDQRYGTGYLEALREQVD